jgi:aminoglycoside phosphotransferase (APT) family kinase protein
LVDEEQELMNSITKTNISKDNIMQMVKKAFGEDTALKGVKELKGGFFNTSYLLTFQDNRKVVLKISPSRDIKVMRYEKDIMVNEVCVLNKISSDLYIPVPKVLFYDTDMDIIKRDYFFMNFVHGYPLNDVYDELTEIQRSNVSSELGIYARKVTGIKSDYFGDISKKDKQFKTWSETFLFMIKELLEDARDNRVKLIYDYTDIYQMIEEHREALDMVKEPSLIHKDLWKGNIFVDPKTAEIGGIIDYERSIYGDVLMEPVCGFLLNNYAFMNSFLGRTYLEDDEKIRSIVYRIYLFIIMITECSYRQYPWENSDKWAREQLGEAFEDLVNFEG